MKTFSSFRAAVIRVNRWAIALTSFSMVWLIGCDDWFHDHDDRKRNAVTDAISADHPATLWKLDYTPDGRLLVTQRPASITSIKDGHKKKWLSLDSVVAELGDAGVFDIAVDPEFDENRYVYIAYTYVATKRPLAFKTKIVRYREYSTSEPPVFDHVVLDGMEGKNLPDINALEFGPDRMLYVTTSERFVPGSGRELPVYSKKILRITRDGDVPTDNPIQNSFVYSYPHENKRPQGLTISSQEKAGRGEIQQVATITTTPQ